MAFPKDLTDHVPPPPGATPPNWFDRQPSWLRHLMTTTATMLVSMFVAWLALKTGVPVPPAVVQTEPTSHTAAKPGAQEIPPPPDPMAMGWNSTAEYVAESRVIKTAFQQTPAGADAPLPKAVYQWQTFKKIGRTKSEKNQNPIGSCVGFGSTTAVEAALACAIAAGRPFEFTEYSEEVTYALSRVDIGKGRLRGQDGSVGGWAAQTWTELGGLPKIKFDGADYSKYDPARCRSLGDKGVTPAIKAECKKYTIGDAALLRTWLDVKKALAAGAGVYTCSRVGFTAARDSNGVARVGSNWGHCMNVDGYHVDDDGTEYAHFDNSWNRSYHTGPVGWGEPNPCGFWAKSSTVATMLSEGDSWAVSAVKGFPKLELDWFTLNRPAKARDPFALRIDADEFRAANRHALAW